MTVPESVRGQESALQRLRRASSRSRPAASIPASEPNRLRPRRRPGGHDTEEDDAQNPYGVTETNLDPRCPHCAYELDPPDARICLHCGYDMIKRAAPAEYQDLRADRPATGSSGCCRASLAFSRSCVVIAAGIYYHYYLPYDMLKDKDANDLLKDRLGIFNKDPGPDAVVYMFHPGHRSVVRRHGPGHDVEVRQVRVQTADPELYTPPEKIKEK